MNYIIPPEKWQMPVLFCIAIFIGFGLLAFYISNAPSYLSDKPETCVNCHIMTPQYATWSHSSHKAVTSCNDCHVPHNNVINKYFFKAKDGLRHATIFTLRTEPQVILIKDAGKNVVQQNCIRCHLYQIDNLRTKNITLKKQCRGEGKLCWGCHKEIPHGTVNGLASTPYARVPHLKSPVPGWISKYFKKSSK